MKNKNQLLQELESFSSFVVSLTDLSEDILTESLYEDISIKKIIATIHVQDKLYLEYYFPKMNKDEKIEEHDKEKILKDTEEMIEKYVTKEIIAFFVKTRKELVGFLHRLSQEHIHSFFEIDNVKFTLYDHIEHIIWNDFISKDEILKAII